MEFFWTISKPPKFSLLPQSRTENEGKHNTFSLVILSLLSKVFLSCFSIKVNPPAQLPAKWKLVLPHSGSRWEWKACVRVILSNLSIYIIGTCENLSSHTHWGDTVRLFSRLSFGEKCCRESWNSFYVVLNKDVKLGLLLFTNLQRWWALTNCFTCQETGYMKWCPAGFRRKSENLKECAI